MLLTKKLPEVYFINNPPPPLTTVAKVIRTEVHELSDSIFVVASFRPLVNARNHGNGHASNVRLHEPREAEIRDNNPRPSHRLFVSSPQWRRPGFHFTGLLNGTAAISSCFASAVCSTGCWARACTGKPSSGGAVGWASTMARPGSSGNRAAKAWLGGDGL